MRRNESCSLCFVIKQQKSSCAPNKIKRAMPKKDKSYTTTTYDLVHLSAYLIRLTSAAWWMGTSGRCEEHADYNVLLYVVGYMLETFICGLFKPPTMLLRHCLSTLSFVAVLHWPFNCSISSVCLMLPDMPVTSRPFRCHDRPGTSHSSASLWKGSNGERWVSTGGWSFLRAS